MMDDDSMSTNIFTEMDFYREEITEALLKKAKTKVLERSNIESIDYEIFLTGDDQEGDYVVLEIEEKWIFCALC